MTWRCAVPLSKAIKCLRLYFAPFSLPASRIHCSSARCAPTGSSTVVPGLLIARPLVLSALASSGLSTFLCFEVDRSCKRHSLHVHPGQPGLSGCRAASHRT